MQLTQPSKLIHISKQESTVNYTANCNDISEKKKMKCCAGCTGLQQSYQVPIVMGSGFGIGLKFWVLALLTLFSCYLGRD